MTPLAGVLAKKLGCVDAKGVSMLGHCIWARECISIHVLISHYGCRCIIGAFGALSSPLAGVMAEKLFGYKGGGHSGPAHSSAHAPAAHDAAHKAAQAELNVANARSLENGLLIITVVPTVSHLHRMNLPTACYVFRQVCAAATLAAEECPLHPVSVTMTGVGLSVWGQTSSP